MGIPSRRHRVACAAAIALGLLFAAPAGAAGPQCSDQVVRSFDFKPPQRALRMTMRVCVMTWSNNSFKAWVQSTWRFGRRAGTWGIAGYRTKVRLETASPTGVGRLPLTSECVASPKKPGEQIPLDTYSVLCEVPFRGGTACWRVFASATMKLWMSTKGVDPVSFNLPRSPEIRSLPGSCDPTT